MKRTTTRIISAFLLTASSLAFLLVAAALLPGRVDRLLLTNDDLCRAGVDSLKQDGGREAAVSTPKGIAVLFYEFADLILWKFIVHLFGDHAHEQQDHQTESWDRSEESQCARDNDEHDRALLHPICRNYREFRSVLDIRQIWIPWNWYYSRRLRLKGVSIRSPTGDACAGNGDRAVGKRTDPKESVRSSGWLGGTWGLSRTIYNIVRSRPRQIDPSVATHPPSLQIESVDVNFRSWTKPVVSLHVEGAAINIVVRKGRLLHLPSLKREEGEAHESAHPTEDNTGFSVTIGDLTIQEAIDMLPQPPEREGIYPMIGLLNVSNVTVNVLERAGNRGDRSFSNRLMRLEVPDAFFGPVVDLTSANQPEGIDRFHFQPLLESEFANALRRHLLSEAEGALRTSLAKTFEFTDLLKEQGAKIHDQFHNLVQKTQQLYVDQWIELAAQTLDQTRQHLWHGWINNTAPVARAFDSWMQGVTRSISDPTQSPLKTATMHHWNKVVREIHNHTAAVTKANQNLNDWKYVLDEFKSTMHDWAVKSKKDMDELVASCESEIKDIWLAWHLQFLPDLG